MKRNPIDIEELRKRFTYSPVTGRIFSKRASREVGAIISGKNGYLCVWVKNKRILCHHVAWALHYGYVVEAPAQIDHINGNRSDNRLANLRMVSAQMQMRNVRVGRNNVTGVTGVHFDKRTNCYGASINVNRKQIWLGRHNTLEEAAAVRKAAERQYGWPT